MSTEVASISLKKNELSKIDRNPREFGSNNSRSDRFLSASKSNKAFEQSLRKSDSISLKPDQYNSPLKKKLLFGKSEQENPKDNKHLYIVDLTKKIKKVESPFPKNSSACETQQNQQCSETNMLVSSFDSISQKIEDQVESSRSIEKINAEPEEFEFKNLALEIKEVIQKFDIEDSKISLNQQEIINMVSEESHHKSSMDVSLKSKSSQAIRLRKKQKKIRKKREKQMAAKKIKYKLNNITNFVEDLHRREVHTDRKELIGELTQHLCEGKFGRLRNELKKLI